MKFFIFIFIFLSSLAQDIPSNQVIAKQIIEALDFKKVDIVKRIQEALTNNNNDSLKSKEFYSAFSNELTIYIEKNDFPEEKKQIVKQGIILLNFENDNFDYLKELLEIDRVFFQTYLLDLLILYNKNNHNELLKLCKFFLQLDIDKMYLKYAMRFQLTTFFEKKLKERIITTLKNLKESKLFSKEDQEGFILLGSEFLVKLGSYPNAIKYLKLLLINESTDITNKVNYLLVLCYRLTKKDSELIYYAESYLAVADDNHKNRDLELYYIEALLNDKRVILSKAKTLEDIFEKRQDFNIEALELLNEYFVDKPTFIPLRIKILTLIANKIDEDKKYYYALYKRSLLYFLIGERQKAYEDVNRYIKLNKDALDNEVVVLYQLQFLDDVDKRIACWQLMKHEDDKVRLLAFEQILLTIDVKDTKVLDEILANISNNLYNLSIYLKWLSFVNDNYINGNFSKENVQSFTEVVNSFFRLNKNLIVNLTGYDKYLVYFCQFYHFDDWQEDFLLFKLNEIGVDLTPYQVVKFYFLIAQVYEKKHFIEAMQNSYQYVYFSPFSNENLRQKVLEKISIRNIDKNLKNNTSRLESAIKNGYFKVTRKIYEDIYYKGEQQDNNYLAFQITKCFFKEGFFNRALMFLKNEKIAEKLSEGEFFSYYYLIAWGKLQVSDERFLDTLIALEEYIDNKEQRYLVEKLYINYCIKIGRYNEAHKLIDEHLALSYLEKEDISASLFTKLTLLYQQKKITEANDFLIKNESSFTANDLSTIELIRTIFYEKLANPQDELKIKKISYSFIDFDTYLNIKHYLNEIKNLDTRLALLDNIILNNNSVYTESFIFIKIQWLNEKGDNKRIIEEGEKALMKPSNSPQYADLCLIIANAYKAENNFLAVQKIIDKMLLLKINNDSQIIEALLIKVKTLSPKKWQEKINLLIKAEGYLSSKDEKIKIAIEKANITYSYASLENDLEAYKKANEYYLELSLLDEQDYSYIRIVCSLRSKNYDVVHQLLSGDILTKEKTFLKGVTYYQQENYSNAKSLFKTIIDDYPDSQLALNSFFFLNRIVAIKEKNKEEFVDLEKKLFSKLINTKIFRLNSSVLNHHLAYSLWFLEDYEKAQKYWYRLLKSVGKDIEFWLIYNQFFLPDKNFKAINVAFETYYQNHKGELAKVAKYKSSHYNIRLGNYNKALKELEELQEVVTDEKLDSIQIFYASLSYYLGLFNNSKRVIDKLIKKGDVKFNFLHQLYNDITFSWVNQKDRRERAKMALKQYDDLLENKVNKPFCLYGKSQVYKLLRFVTDKEKKWRQRYLATLEQAFDLKVPKSDRIAQYYYCLAGYELVDEYFLSGNLQKAKELCTKISLSGYRGTQKAKNYLINWKK